MRTDFVAALSAALLLVTFSHALAQPRLAESTPAPGSTTAAPRAIKLTFSEKIAPASGVQLSMGDGMAVPTRATLSDDGKTLTARPTAPFMSGTWTLSWHAVSAGDGRPSEGSYNFTIR